ncbi:MAG: DNA repair protein RecN [Pseudomonadota bacterium]
MLTHLAIRDFALIEQLDLEFSAGFSVLTGETGAGKSILLDALQLVLGGRASASVLRAGASKADVSAAFDVRERPAVRAWLSDHDLEPEDTELLLRRVVNADGRSRAYVNGVQTPIQKMRELGERLVEIHGQHEFQTLVRPPEQLRLLDLFANNTRLVSDVQAAFGRWRDINAELEALRSSAAMSPAELDLLRHQVDELERVAVEPQVLETLHAEHRQLASAESLMASTGQAAETLADAVTPQLSAVVNDLKRQQSTMAALSEPLDLLESALLQAQEAESVLSRQVRELEANPQRVAELDRQLDEIHSLARKHRLAAEDLAGHLGALRSRCEAAADADETEQELLKALMETEAAYREAAASLSKARQRAAKKLGTAITKTISEVGMDQAQFAVDVSFDAQKPPSRTGLDSVAFLIQTNPGSPAGTLDRVASGGELSRVALAVKVALAANERGRTMIFDEVDAGVGGATAQRVGQKLRELAATGQVLSVTHLPQVAACGHQHYRVEKEQNKKSTLTRVLALDDEARLQELSRMLGGVEITEQTVAHAAEMLSQGEGGAR